MNQKDETAPIKDLEPQQDPKGGAAVDPAVENAAAKKINMSDVLISGITDGSSNTIMNR